MGSFVFSADSDEGLVKPNDSPNWNDSDSTIKWLPTIYFDRLLSILHSYIETTAQFYSVEYSFLHSHFDDV